VEQLLQFAAASFIVTGALGREVDVLDCFTR